MTNDHAYELNDEIWGLLKKTSRTFYLSIKQLPKEAGNSLCLAYLLLRVSDYLEDNEVMPVDQKIAALNSWTQILNGENKPEELQAFLPPIDQHQNPDLQAAQNADKILRRLSSLPAGLQVQIIKHVTASTIGMARWVGRGPVFLDETDLDDYMHEVAGRVGYLSTEIFAWYYPSIRPHLDRLMPMAHETGLGLQTVNIIRGMRKDYERGWVYIPNSFCALCNIKPENLFDPAYQTQALQVVDLLAKKAQRHLETAVEYIRCLPPWLHHLRLACIWPLLFAARTLSVSRRNIAVLLGEVKITRDDVKQIIFDTTLLGWSNIWVANYYHKLQQAPKT
jgi:farnesyl-diphosphate farnesyltransferase